MSSGYICPKCGNIVRTQKTDYGYFCVGTKNGVLNFKHGAVFMDFHDQLPAAEPSKPEIDYLGAAREVSGR